MTTRPARVTSGVSVTTSSGSEGRDGRVPPAAPVRTDPPAASAPGPLTRLLPHRVASVAAWRLALAVIGGTVWLGTRVVAEVALVVVPTLLALAFAALLAPLKPGCAAPCRTRSPPSSPWGCCSPCWPGPAC